MNWKAQILPVKVDDASGGLSVANIAKGIIWAADNKARVINLSLGTSSDSSTLRNAIDYAYNKGCVIVAATGNAGTSNVSYPARYPNVIGAGGTADGKTRAAITNYGTGLDVLAVSAYYSTTPAGGYSNMAGTSFASPQIAGLASLIIGLNPDLKPSEVREYIINGASGNGVRTDTLGYGIMNMGKSLQLVMEDKGKIKDPEKPKIEEPKIEEPVKLPPTLTLTGSSSITLKQGTEYIEPGFKATDCNGKDITSKVTVQSTLNINKAGTYKITYTVTDEYMKTASQTRTIIIEEVKIETPKREVQTFKGNFGGNNKATSVDYKINVNSIGQLDLDLSNDNSKASLDLILLDVKGNQVSKVSNSSGKSGKIALNLTQTGTYTARVNMVSGNGNFGYTLTATLPLVGETPPVIPPVTPPVVEPKLVTSITLSQTASVEVNKTISLVANVLPADAKNKEIEWSSNSSNATVSSSGVVTGKAVGTAIITAKAKDGSGKIATCTLTITAAPSTVKKEVQTFKGNFGGSNKATSADYKINVTKTGIIDLNLINDNNKANLELVLMDASGKVIAKVNNTNGKAGDISINLTQTGTYTARINMVTGNGNFGYTLTTTLP